ncbi:MAG TPA: heavy metal-associated domain-containing protein [Anaerolineaceae bacterium]|nr:heavy metal-associated domain-containing protein [Anaerolineaceae bacterium]
MKTILRSKDLSCPSCIVKIEKALKSEKGVTDAKVFFNSGRIEVQHNEELIEPQKLVDIVRSIGYEATISPF